MKTTIEERTKALNTLLTAKLQHMQQLDTDKNAVLTEIVQIQGKLALLEEMTVEEKTAQPTN